MSQLFDKLETKPDREDLERLEDELKRARAAPDPRAALEALYTKVLLPFSHVIGRAQFMSSLSLLLRNLFVASRCKDFL